MRRWEVFGGSALAFGVQGYLFTGNSGRAPPRRYEVAIVYCLLLYLPREQGDEQTVSRGWKADEVIDGASARTGGENRKGLRPFLI